MDNIRKLNLEIVRKIVPGTKDYLADAYECVIFEYKDEKWAKLQIEGTLFACITDRSNGIMFLVLNNSNYKERIDFTSFLNYENNNFYVGEINNLYNVKTGQFYFRSSDDHIFCFSLDTSDQAKELEKSVKDYFSIASSGDQSNEAIQWMNIAAKFNLLIDNPNKQNFISRIVPKGLLYDIH